MTIVNERPRNKTRIRSFLQRAASIPIPVKLRNFIFQSFQMHSSLLFPPQTPQD